MLYNESPIDYRQSFNFASGATESDVEDLGGDTLIALHIPAMTNTSLALHAAYKKEGGSMSAFAPVYDSTGTAVTIPCGASPRFAALDMTATAGIRYAKLVGTANEAAAREIVIPARPV